ncbi:MAG: proline--tRNA ligase [Nanohaloarchaea archaeon QH_8_44_6]|nr:MAG: proline--tRNA ligase [Nanohaloarchaea archaeon QH_8_44_6]
MKRSNLFVTSSKETEADTHCKSAELAFQAGLVHSYGSGTFGFSHLGQRVLENIEEIIREEMDRIGQEVKMNIFQTSRLWKKSGRWNNFEGEEFFNFKNRDGKEFTIAATHEEASVELTRKYIRSYRDLDLTIYQIGRKFRDDHARNGLLRAKEFVMKDAYSFHKHKQGLQEKYLKFLDAYGTIFDRLGLEYSVVVAENGSMGGSQSHEFMAEAKIGSDTYLKCDNCEFGTKDLETEKCGNCGSELRKVNGIEIGHCFQLGTRYSESMNLTFDTENGEEKEVIMASYGIGVSRLISAIIEQNHDQNGITWNEQVSAFTVSVIAARHEEKVTEKAEEIYQKLHEQANLRWTVQFGSDSLIVETYPVVGNRFLEEEIVEVEDRSGKTTAMKEGEVVEEVT